MDVLASVEPQMAIPVVGVVLCALLVYIFGFQKTQEPTFQHLAALTTKSKSPNTRQRSTTPQVKSTLKAKEKSSGTANGHAVQEKSSPKANGSLKSPKARDVVSNKENVRPQKVKKDKELVEDLEAGDWIQAVSRKDKKNKLEKTKQESPKAAKASVPVTPTVETPIEVLQDVTSKVATIQTEQVKVEAVVAAAAAAAAKEQDAPVPAKPTKKKAKAPAAPPAAAVAESSPKKEKSGQEPKVTAPEVKATADPVAAEEPVMKSAPATPLKKASKAEEAQAASSSADPRNNIAFDEMGDTWEEAKSRGAKKRRARKD